MKLLLFCFFFTCTLVQAQEAPNASLQVELFGKPAKRQTFRQDFCDTSLKVVAGLLPLDDALQGMALHVALADGAFVNLDYNTTQDGTIIQETVRLKETYAGLVPDILDHICLKAGCTWRKTYRPIFYQDLGTNHTFNDLLTWSLDMYDLNAEWWMRSIERLASGANYAQQWYDGTIIMVAKTDGASGEHDAFDPWGWLAPFDWSVWFLILVNVVFSSLVYWVLELLNPNSDASGGDGTVLEPSQITWMSATSFAGQFEFDPQTGPARLFTFSIAFWSLLMTSAYTANLASFLVIRNRPGLSIETIEQAVNQGMTMCVWRSSQSDLTISQAFPTYAEDSGLLKRTNQRGVFEGLSNGNCRIAITEVSSWEAFQNDKTVNGDCRLARLGRDYKTEPASFTFKSDAGIRCTSLLRDVVNVYMFEMELDGNLTRLWNRYIEETATVDCLVKGAQDLNAETERGRRLLRGGSATQDNKHRQLAGAGGARTSAAAKSAAPENSGNEETIKLSLINMGGVFLLHFCLSMLAVIYALISWIYNGTQRSKAVYQFEQQNRIPRVDKVGDNPLSHLSFCTAQTTVRTGDVLDLRIELNSRLNRIEQHLGIVAVDNKNNAWQPLQRKQHSSYRY